MLEVIPNWHPLFVHFSIALLSMSSIFFVSLKVVSNISIKEQLNTLAYWNLWLGTGFAVITAIAGWFAYNSVAHDTPSHEVMTDHRNWALITLSVFVVASLWSVKQYKSVKETNMIFTFIMVMALVLLMSTGWRGSEAVYRYGLGVMSLPKAKGEGHAHEHADGEGHSSESAITMNKNTKSDSRMHENAHDDSKSPEGHKDNIDEHDHAGHKH